LNGMKPLIPAIIIFSLIAIPFFVFAGSVSVTVSMQVISMPGSAEYSGMPLLQTDVWNYVNLTITPFPSGEINLISYYGNTLPSNRSQLNYYEWSYSPSNSTFYDPLYGTYVNNTLSQASSNLITFAAGMFDKAYAGTWTLEIFAGSTLIYNTSFYVEQPEVGMVSSSPTFDITVTPFTPSSVNSSAFGEAELVKNSGSLPETVQFQFNTSFISVNGNDTSLMPGQSKNFYLTVNAGSWSPQIIPFSGTVTASFSNQIPKQGDEQVIPRIQMPMGGQITVGLPGYDVSVFSNISVQYQRTMTAAAGKLSTLSIYLTGKNTVQVSVSTVDLTLKFASAGNQNSTSNITLTLNPAEEMRVLIGIVPYQHATQGEIITTVSMPDSPVSRSFTTYVTISGTNLTSPVKNQATAQTNLPLLGGIAAFLAAMVAVFMMRRKKSVKVEEKGRRDRIKPRKGWER
jgi:hypothetical protein